MSSNYIRNVALIGATGRIGSYFLKHLLATNKHTVTVLTRTDSTATIPSHANQRIAKVDYSSEETVVEALRGMDFLIITLTARAPPTLHGSIVRAAKKAGVPYVMPNAYGWAASSDSPLNKDPLLSRFTAAIDEVKSIEGLSCVSLGCGFWYEFSVGMGEQWYGFDIKNRTATLYDEGLQKINTSTWEQCGRAVASFLSLPVSKQADGSPAVQDWAGKQLVISSFLVSQRDMLDSLHRVLGTTDKDWTIKYEPAVERYKTGMQELQQGNMLGFPKAMYARLFFKSGEGEYQRDNPLMNGKLGLPVEDLDEATKRAVQWVEDGTLAV